MIQISVIIPTYNEEGYIRDCIDSVLESTLNKDSYEVLLIDGGSNDNTKSIIQHYVNTFTNITFYHNPKQYAPVAFNMGIENAAGKYLMILGAHSKISANYIEEAVKFLEENSEVDVVGGVLKNKGFTPVSKAIANAMSSPFGVGGAKFRTGNFSGFVETVAFGVYRKEIFQSVGLFNENLIRAQDGEMNHRIKKSGRKIYLLNDIYAEYIVRSSFKKLFRQYFQYGYWKVVLNVMNRSFVSVRQLVPFFFVGLVFLWPFTLLASMDLFFVFSALILLHLLASILTSFRFRGSIKVKFFTLISFYILHISYGIGYAKGILDFVIFRKKYAASK